ncbi:hypothetical protein JBL43_07010 [Aureibaculum sp. A20]|uniref:VWA domain-containing protein n=1 Tax=Aureibaculum flavum TaxID=2795986 RepID=A0ABS0WPS3_9FLAO|nr:hypothetical protein [Aureibaculum flavum]MBJ2173980.1 hypothetical protein [Aureibaculum flavum]
MNKKAKTDQIPSRRDFFVKIALASVAVSLPPFMLSSCENKIEYQGSGLSPFKVWEEMLEALKTSPDFLPQRVEDLIVSKDLEAMYNFVKNEITLIPTTTNAISNYDLGNGHKWGLEAVLRCGMATPREKADLLAQMYTKAGISSKVVYENTAITENDVPSFFNRPIDRAFKPDISNSQFKRWEKEMGGSSKEPNQKELIKDYTADANILGDKIIESIPNIDDFGTEFNFKWDNSATPTVEFTHNNKTQYAHLFDPKTPFGEKHNSSNGLISKAKAVKENKEKVSLKITYRDTIDHQIVRDLIQGEWNATELVGKQIQLSFLHGLSLEEQVVTSIGSMRVFTPALALQAIDKDLEYVQERSFIADPITIDGKRIPIVEGKTFGANGDEILAKPQPQLQKEVHRLTVIPSASGYPIVKLSIDARDAADKMIEGLSARDFKITDNGKPISALLENNQRTPKILVLSDGSGSMPAAYAKEGMKKFNASLEQKIKESYPAAIIDFWKTPSSLFTWLLKASQTNYDLILFATDGDNDDELLEKNLKTYNSGPPAIILNVYDDSSTRLESFNKMAEITNGIVLNAKNQDKVLDEIKNYIIKMELPPYVFTYASADKTNPHNVEVTIDNERLKATGSYTVPKLEMEQKNGIAGVYLELKVGNKSPIKRVLAGWDPIAGYYSKPDNTDVASIKELFLGGIMLAVEGEGPTMAVALSDVLKSKLSNREWGEAYLENNIKKASEELSKGSVHIPSILLPMLAPLQDQVTATSITYPTGYRMCILKNMVGLNQPSVFTFDYLPTSFYETIAVNKSERFSITLKKTAQLAVREGSLFQESTYALLEDTNTIDSKSANIEGWIKEVINNDNIDYQYWNEYVLRGKYGYTTIFDKGASSKSFWLLKNGSGELYGILPDGSGGGGDTFEEQLEDFGKVIDILLLGAGLAGLVNPSTAVVGLLGKTLVKLYAIASESIIVMDTRGMDEEIIKTMQKLACNIRLEILKFSFGKIGDAAGTLETIIGLMGGKSPFSC